MKRLIILLICFVCANGIFANPIYLHPLKNINQPSFQQVQIQLSHADYLSGKFKQIRKMQLLSSPLVSSGNFVLSKHTGLSWIQTTPFPSTLKVTAIKIEQTIGNNPPTVITKTEQPIVFSFTNIFLSIFKGNTKAVQEYFKIYFVGNTKAWQIALKPIGSPLNKAISSIELSGGKYIHTITVNETKHNQMVLHLFDVTVHHV